MTAKMEKEIPVICLVYIERLLIKSGFALTPSSKFFFFFFIYIKFIEIKKFVGKFSKIL